VRGVRRAESQKIADRKTNSRNTQQEMPIQVRNRHFVLKIMIKI